MAYMTPKMRKTLRKAVNSGSFLHVNSFVWKAGQAFPELSCATRAGKTLWYTNTLLLFGYTAYLGAKLAELIFFTEGRSLVALFSVLFVFLLYAYTVVLQFMVLTKTEDILGFLQKFCSHFTPEQQDSSFSGLERAPALLRICEKIMVATVHGTTNNAAILASIASYQLDTSFVIAGVLPGHYWHGFGKILGCLIHAYMGYVLWCLHIFLAVLFFAVTFTAMVALDELLM